MIEDDCYFLGVHIRLSTQCKIFFSLQSLSLSLSFKSHICALELADLLITSLLFDLIYKFITVMEAGTPIEN